MASSQCPQNQPHHHHRNHEAHTNTTPFHHCPHCPLHHLHNYRPYCPLHTHNSHLNFQTLPPYLPPLPQNSHPFVPLILPSSVTLQHNEANSSVPLISQELEHVELDDEEEDDEPVFVLTDEWREFFAKSKARRKLGSRKRTRT